jgi:hypothetical protein
LSEKALQRSKELWLSQHEGSFKSLLGQRFVGVSSTSSLVSTTPKRGQHRTHIALSTDAGVKTYNVVLGKTLGRSRDAEDELVSRLMLNAILESNSFSGNLNEVFDALNKLSIEAGDEIVETVTQRENALDLFLREKTELKSTTKPSTITITTTEPSAAAGGGLEFDPSIVKYKKDIVSQANKSMPPALNQSKSSHVNEDNLLFIPHSMLFSKEKEEKEEKEEGKYHASSSASKEGMLTYSNFKTTQRTIVYPGSFNPLHKVSVCRLFSVVTHMIKVTSYTCTF